MPDQSLQLAQTTAGAAMSEPTTLGLFVASAAPAAGAAALIGVPVDVIMWALFGAAIAVTRGPRITWSLWIVLGAMGAFAMAFGVGALLGTLSEHLPEALTFGIKPQALRTSLAFVGSLCSQQILNRIGAYIDTKPLP